MLATPPKELTRKDSCARAHSEIIILILLREAVKKVFFLMASPLPPPPLNDTAIKKILFFGFPYLT